MRFFFLNFGIFGVQFQQRRRRELWITLMAGRFDYLPAGKIYEKNGKKFKVLIFKL